MCFETTGYDTCNDPYKKFLSVTHCESRKNQFLLGIFSIKNHRINTYFFIASYTDIRKYASG